MQYGRCIYRNRKQKQSEPLTDLAASVIWCSKYRFGFGNSVDIDASTQKPKTHVKYNSRLHHIACTYTTKLNRGFVKIRFEFNASSDTLHFNAIQQMTLQPKCFSIENNQARDAAQCDAKCQQNEFNDRDFGVKCIRRTVNESHSRVHAQDVADKINFHSIMTDVVQQE